MSDPKTVLRNLQKSLAIIPAHEHGCDDLGRDALQKVLDSPELQADLREYLAVAALIQPPGLDKERLQLSVRLSYIIAQLRHPHFARNTRSIVRAAKDADKAIAAVLAYNAQRPGAGRI